MVTVKELLKAVGPSLMAAAIFWVVGYPHTREQGQELEVACQSSTTDENPGIERAEHQTNGIRLGLFCGIEEIRKHIKRKLLANIIDRGDKANYQ